MTNGAIVPAVVVRTRKNRKKQRVVFAKVSGFAGGVTLVARRRVVRIARNPLMLGIHFGSIVFVAGDALEHLEVSRSDVADRTGVPLAVVLAREDGEEHVVVGHERRRPTGHFVAGLAQRGKPAGAVVGGQRRLVILEVTLVAWRPRPPKICRRHAGVARKAVDQQVSAL